MKVNSNNPTILELTWELPEEENGVVFDYFVRLNGNETAMTNDTLYQIENLSACTEYNIGVSASTSIGQGEVAETVGSTSDESKNQCRSTVYRPIIKQYIFRIKINQNVPNQSK